MSAALEELERACGRAVGAAGDAGAGDAEAWAEQATSREVRVYDGAVESLTDATSRGIGLRVFDDGRSGYAYGTDLGDGGLRALAEAAGAAVAVSDPDEYAGLPDELGVTPVEGLHTNGAATWSTERKVELALAIERAARSTPGVSNVEDTVYADADGSVALANSRGLAASYESTTCWAYSSAFAGEGTDLMTGLGVAVARDPAALDAEAIGKEAAGRALALTGARQPEGRRCPVVLDAFVAASFVGFIGAMLSADAVQRGRSLFADREGDEIATEVLRLTDDGIDPEGPSSAPFDGEGSPTRRTALVEGGRLATFLFDSRTARKAGRKTTGSATRGSYRSPPSVGPRNLVIEPGESDLDGLFRDAGDGLYVTEVTGLHSGVNPVSGTFSVGATGRLIGDGALADPVREITIASDLVSMLRSVRAVGSDARWVPFGGSVKAVPILIDEMAVSGA